MPGISDLYRRAISLVRVGVTCLVVSSPLLISVRAQEASESDYRAAQLARMQKIAESFEITLPSTGKVRSGTLQATPVLRYADPTRRNDEATLWLWSERDRPVALLAVEYYAKSPVGPRWLYEVASLSPEKITVQRGEEIRWTAREPGQARQKLSDVPEPAAASAARQIQLKQLRQRFTAHEKTPVEGRIQLRPLPNPLYRYQDATNGLFDAAVFAYTNGTNPEVLLVLEVARREADKPAEWTYAFVQMTGGEVYATLDDREVWTRTEADPPAVRDAYANGWLTDATPVNPTNGPLTKKP